MEMGIRRIIFALCLTIALSLASSYVIALACGQEPDVIDTTGDVSDAGIPAEPLYRFDPATQPEGYLSYDLTHFDVYSRTMHQRQVIVAIAKDVVMQPQERLNLSQFVFNSWASQWKAFGGCLYDQYRVKVVNASPYDGFETEWGFEKSAYQFLDGNGHMTGCWQEFFAHGIFHAWPTWWGGKWFQEGFTQYYGYREEYSYFSLINEDLAWYKSAVVGSDIDIPLAEAEQFFGTPNSVLYYRKGALVAYMLDREMLARTGCPSPGSSRVRPPAQIRIQDAYSHTIYLPLLQCSYWPCKSLDDVFRYYHRVALGDEPDAHPLAVVNEITGGDFTDFFTRYISGTEQLPLESIVDYPDHGPHGSGSPAGRGQAGSEDDLNHQNDNSVQGGM
jgi:hypothetical protein